jgi:hypothetical protein
MHLPQLCLLNIFLAIGLNDGCVKIIDLSISRHNLTSMACHYQRKILIIMAKPSCLTFWIYDANITNFHFRKMTTWRLRHWPKWERLFVSMKVLTFWVGECTCIIPEGYGSSSYMLGLCQMLHWWHHYV